MAPTAKNGKVCYIEMPTTDVARSADFYANVFGWSVRRRGDGATAFDDTTGQVSGAWRLGRPASDQPGLLIYIMVDSVAAACDAVVANGGQIVQAVGGDPGELTARFRDPGGNAGPSLYTVDVTGRNEQSLRTPSYASDPSWSPLLQ